MQNLKNSPKVFGFMKEQDKIFPPMVFVEITNVCNLQCIHCPYSFISKQSFYRPRHLELNIYKKIVDEISLHKDVILRIVCDGEPMIHPNFLEMVSYAKKKAIQPLCITTNGTFLTESKALELLINDVDVIEISLDAINKDSYERIRKGSNFDLVMSNVHGLIELKNKIKANTKIMVSIIDQPEIKYELKDFFDYWQPRVDKVILRTYTSIGGLVENGGGKVNKSNRWPCPLLWTRIFISVDGFIKFCVDDWLDKTILADIRDSSINSIWDSAAYNNMRERHLSKEFQLIPHCYHCKDWSARDWEYNYFYALKKIL